MSGRGAGREWPKRVSYSSPSFGPYGRRLFTFLVKPFQDLQRVNCRVQGGCCFLAHAITYHPSVLDAAKCGGAYDVGQPPGIMSALAGHECSGLSRKAEISRAQCDRQRCRSLGFVVNLEQGSAFEQEFSSKSVNVAGGVNAAMPLGATAASSHHPHSLLYWRSSSPATSSRSKIYCC